MEIDRAVGRWAFESPDPTSLVREIAVAVASGGRNDGAVIVSMLQMNRGPICDKCQGTGLGKLVVASVASRCIECGGWGHQGQRVGVPLPQEAAIELSVAVMRAANPEMAELVFDELTRITRELEAESGDA